MKEEPTYRYDAFLSYSQRDHATVSWLRGVLADYWVPRRPRRRIFLDRKSMGSGVLREGIVTALRDSRFLIVCCSEGARKSEWVDQEVAEFLKTHSDREVLICAVGEAGEIVFPASIEELQARRGPLRWPDLRGFPEAKPKKEQQPAIEEALSLLAELLGFPGKDALVDTIARGRARLVRLAAALAVAIVAAGAGLWYWLYQTTPGALYLAQTRVLRAAATEVKDTPYLDTTAHAFGVMGKRRHVERLARAVKNREFRGIVLAAGYAALPEPDCARARKALEGMDRSAALMGPRSFLLVQKSCGGDWGKLAKPDPLAGDALPRWGFALAATGHAEEARVLLTQTDFPAKERAPLAVAIAIGSGKPLELTDADLASWNGDDTAQGRLYSTLQLLEKVDYAGRLRDPGGRKLVEHAVGAYVDLRIAGFGNWNHQQQLCAHLAGSGAPDAHQMLGPLPDWALKAPSEAPGLAWRALALHRLGRAEESAACFDHAETAARTFTPQTRSWGEWLDIAQTAALAGDWRRAFRAAEGPGDETTRFQHRCRAIELWAHRAQPQSSWRP